MNNFPYKSILLSILFVLILIYTLFFTPLASYIINRGLGLINQIQEMKNPDPDLPPNFDFVMPPNSIIETVTHSGAIVIKSGNGLKRYFEFDGVERSIVMLPSKQKWRDKQGLYFSGPGYHWPEHNGISRCVVKESQLDFDTVQAAIEWINKKSANIPLVYRDDGLLVSYRKNLSRKQMNVDIYQILIKNKKPVKLKGSNNSAIYTSW